MEVIQKEGVILPELQERFSAYAFSPRPVECPVLYSLFDAARRAPSSLNEQPWRFWVGSDENPEFRERLRGLLNEGNSWAKAAPVLILAGARTKLIRNGNPNRFAGHDTGMATLALMLQAQHLGLASHPMGGYDLAAAQAFIGDPDVEPQAMIAIGYPGDPESLPEAIQVKARNRRGRRAPEEFVTKQYPISTLIEGSLI